MDENKKMAAAKLGVLQYLEDEEEMAGLAPPDESGLSLSHQNLWGLSGRQAQMQMRTMMGMKAFHRKND
jgi:hypothetical protein